MGRLKIVIFTDEFPPKKGGIARYVAALTRCWLDQGIQLILITTMPAKLDDFPELIPGKSYFYVPLDKNTYFYAWKAFQKARAHLAMNNECLWFFPVWNPYSIFLFLYRVLFWEKRKYIVAAHGADILALFPGSSFPVHPLFKKLGRRALKKADLIFSVSNFTRKKMILLGVPDSRIRVFPNGVDVSFFKPQVVNKKNLLKSFGIAEPDRPLLLSVSQLNVRKGLDVAVKVVRSLADEGIMVNYLIIGQGTYETELRKQIAQLNLIEQVYILKDIQDEDLVNFYNICDIFLLLSRQVGDLNVEGFGIVLLEAGACEKPVIAGRSGGIPDAVEDGVTGFLVDPTDINAISQKIKLLLNNRELAKKMGKQARQRIVQKFQWSIIAENMIRTMKQWADD